MLKRIIELIAPSKLLNASDEAQVETIVGDAVCCEYCNGEGGKYIDSRCINFEFERKNGQGYYEACTICKGSRRVQPVITVEWKPYGKIKDEFKTAIN